METGEKTFVIKLYMLISILDETEVAVCSVPVTSVHIKDVKWHSSWWIRPGCSMQLLSVCPETSFLSGWLWLNSLYTQQADNCSTRKVLRLWQTPKQDACFTLLYSHHTTSQTSQDMSPIKSQGSSPTFYTESCTVEQAQSYKHQVMFLSEVAIKTHFTAVCMEEVCCI